MRKILIPVRDETYKAVMPPSNVPNTLNKIRNGFTPDYYIHPLNKEWEWMGGNKNNNPSPMNGC